METNDDEKLSKLNVTLDYIDITKDLNKRVIVGDDIPLYKIGIFSCPICKLFFKDSIVYLKHLNSKEHNREIGMSLEVEESTPEEIAQRLDQWENFYQKGIPVPPLFSKEGVDEYKAPDMTKIDETHEKEYQYEYDYVYEEEENTQ